MDHYYALLKPLPDDFAYLCRVAKCHSRHEKAALRSIRDQFFDIINCQLRHTRIDQEILKYQQNSDTNRKAIESRWNTNRNTKPEARSQIPEESKSTPLASSPNGLSAGLNCTSAAYIPLEDGTEIRISEVVLDALK